MDNLPQERITAILEFLDPINLRRAAAVSRVWNQLAWCAGLSLSCSIVLDRFGNSESQVASLSDVVQHALGHGRQLSLSLTFSAFDDAHWPTVKTVLALAPHFLSILDHLSVTLRSFLLPGFLPALRHPAPNLRELVLLIDPTYGGARFPVPDDTLGGMAPKLRRMVFQGFPLGPIPVPVFLQVINAHLKWINQCRDIEYATHFPRLHRLHLAFRTQSAATKPESFRFDGLRLRTLIIDDWDYSALLPAVARSIDIPKIPVVELIGTKLHPGDPLWNQQDLDALSIRATRQVRHESAHRTHALARVSHPHARPGRAMSHPRAARTPVRGVPARGQ